MRTSRQTLLAASFAQLVSRHAILQLYKASTLSLQVGLMKAGNPTNPPNVPNRIRIVILIREGHGPIYKARREDCKIAIDVVYLL